MKFIPNIYYSKNEMFLIEKMKVLFEKWYCEAQRKVFIDNYTADDMVFDGFFPNYCKQNQKVLFIGREALDISGENYIELLYRAYKKCRIGKRSIDCYKFHYLMFYITYGICNHFPPWESIPYASSLTEGFGQENGISFAYMNISKFSNDSGKWRANWALIDSFINGFEGSSINYFNEEISILEPDLIITMNLENRLYALGEITVEQTGNELSSYFLKTKNKEILLLDLFHFSAPRKSSKEKYYEVVKKYIMERK